MRCLLFFLVSGMMVSVSFPGDFCRGINLNCNNIDNGNIDEIPTGTLKNGIVVELVQYAIKSKKTASKVEEWICLLQPEFNAMKRTTLKARVTSISKTYKDIERRKRVAKYKNLYEFQTTAFLPGKNRQVSSDDVSVQSAQYESENIPNPIPKIQTETELKSQTISHEEQISAINTNANLPPKQVTPTKLYVTPRSNKVNFSSELLDDTNEDGEDLVLLSPRQCNLDYSVLENVDKNFSKDEKRSLNVYVYEINKQEKVLKNVKHDTEKAKQELENLKLKIGHYAVRNVNKRDERARKYLKLLRETERQLLTQKRKNVENSETIQKLTDECRALENKQENEHVQVLKVAEQKKMNAQKTASYYKVKASKLTAKLKEDSIQDTRFQSLKSLLKSKDTHIRELEMTNTILTEQIKENSCQTRNNDGTFSDNVRMCVIELSSLEVACAKVPSVIAAVSNHLFGNRITTEDLPSSTTVQTIVDQGHYIAKSYISEKLAETDNWGLNRDGTTRRKQKILDTSITLASGDVMSLGFSRVAHETADTINNITKEHITELANLNSKNDDNPDMIESYVKTSLKKLAFTMSDRASNEKKADRLLDDWRDDILKDCEDGEKHQVLHFHCMAHVLLGFHRYICMDLKQYEASLSSEGGKLGRDGLPVFKFWNTKGTAAERTLRTVSDVFGPSGDHHGVRDLWEAHCAAKGIKSTVGNYKDNRFNALFQTAAEVFLHRQDFIEVLLTVKSPNLKLKSVLADLQSLPIMTIIQCLGLFYLKITGPYWNLVTGSRVPYVELYSEITVLQDYLELCCEDPASILQLNEHWSSEDNYHIRDIQHRKIFARQLSQIPENEFRDVLFTSVSMVAKAMKRIVEKQLVDFLPGGSFHKTPTAEEMKRTSYAHVTNLGCEHHFGDLDSSQKRRPNASFHHHSSVQLLKRNRVPMMNWLGKMPEEKLKLLMKSSRKGGKELRAKHRAHDNSVLREIHAEMTQKTAPRNKKRKVDSDKAPSKKAKHDPQKKDNDLQDVSPPENVKENDYVAVAYQDAWYPGVVTGFNSEQMLVVKFMTPTRKFGHFMWPAREDIQTVDLAFILKTGFIPDCMNSGRQWHISETTEIVNLYDKFRNVHF